MLHKAINKFLWRSTRYCLFGDLSLDFEDLVLFFGFAIVPPIWAACSIIVGIAYLQGMALSYPAIEILPGIVIGIPLSLLVIFSHTACIVGKFKKSVELEQVRELSI
jgi:hypothetical protein